MTVIAWILFSLCIATSVWWIAVSVRIVRMLGTGLSLRTGLKAQVDASQSVTIIIPAHNEERVLAQCLDSVLAQRWEKLKVIVALDRCTDASESIALTRAEQDDRLTIVRITSCPESWAGKCNASRHGAELAEGEWLLFLDADTRAHPDMTRALIGESIRRDAALLSLLPDLECTSWFDRVSQPVASMALGQIFPPDRVNREERSLPFANGQCMLFRRDWYQRIGGHGAVQDDLLEDLAFARTIHQSGGRVRVLRADGLLVCSMYGDWQAFRRGWTRIFLEASNRNVQRLRKYALRLEVLGVGAPLFMFSSIGVGLAVGIAPVWIAGIALFVLQLIALSLVYSMSKQPLWCTLLYPFGCFEVARAQRRAARLLLTGQPVRGGGREYVLEPR
jgi:chlorobactene glucosyltransferase